MQIKFCWILYLGCKGSSIWLRGTIYYLYIFLILDFCLSLFLLPLPPPTHTVRANYEDGGTGLVRKHDFTRSESENWRLSRDEQNGEDEEGGGWRLAGSRRDNERWCPPSPGGSLLISLSPSSFCLIVS